MNEIAVDIWSDVVCPWCYLGKRRFEVALAKFDHRDAVRVRWRSFELDPGTPARSDVLVPDMLRAKMGLSEAQVEESLEHVTSLAAADGLAYRLAEARPVNTFDVHRLMHLADSIDAGDAMREGLMRAYTSEAADLSDPEVLLDLAADAGLAPDAVAGLLARDDFAAEVREDEALARQLGIRAVPAFVFVGRYLVSGAQSVEIFGAALTRAWTEAAA
ncbi:MAG TPA: DsbA family oxidoreductase [Actinophytocola sp.]|uniref:DsbA family oxidoreductase n=1 Tax=Actinophytocola sp. TaxID=1872138 RepID=UPI002F92B149